MKETSTSEYLSKAAPNGEARDCTVRAMAFALDIPYWQAHKFLAKNGRKPKHGIHFSSTIGRKSRVIMGHRIGYHKCPHKTVGNFVKRHPKGAYIILVTHHALALRDGVVSGLSKGDFGQHIKCYYFVSKINKNDSTSGQQEVDNPKAICGQEESGETNCEQLDKQGQVGN